MTTESTDNSSVTVVMGNVCFSREYVKPAEEEIFVPPAATLLQHNEPQAFRHDLPIRASWRVLAG